MAEPFLGEIRLWALTFAPRGWAFCDGQLLSIAQNTALFSILGTTYGGNGQSTFGLPDLRARTAVHSGNSQGPGLSSYLLGEQGGTETVTLLSTQMPAHSHATSTRNEPANPANYTNIPTPGYFVSRYLYHAASTAFGWRNDNTSPTALHPTSVSVAGGSQAHENRQPLLAMNWCVAIDGIFPTRN